MRKDTLCWKCDKACGGEAGCSWFNGFIPIDGWEAKETDISYYIKRCPLFILDKRIPHRAGEKCLSVKELAVMLGRSPRTVMRYSKERIIDILWGFGFDARVRDVSKRRKIYIKERNMKEDEKVVSEKIFQIMNADNLNKCSKGYTYLFEALYIGIMESDINVKTYGEIYAKLSNKFGERVSSIERAIRYCILNSNISKTFKEYLNIVRMRIRVGI